MGDFHITRKLWWALETGRVPRKVFDKMFLEHHLATCATCREEYEASRKSHDYSAMFERLEARQADQIQLVADEEHVAKTDYDEILRHQPEAWQGLLHSSPQRFQSVSLAQLILDKSFSYLPNDPQSSLVFARLAQDVALRSTSPLKGEMLVLSFSQQGNALRALGRLPEAGERFQQARTLIREGFVDGSHQQTIVDLSVYARVAWAEGVYFRELCEWEPAEENLNRAALLFAVEDDRESLHGVVLSLAELYLRSDKVTEALDAVGRVLSNLTEEENPGRYWIARFNHASYLAEAGFHDDALAELSTCRAAPGFPRDEFMTRRVQWLEGRIARELGQLKRAEQRLSKVRAGYLAEGSGVNMALVSLDLALVYLQQGRAAELRALASEMNQIFDSNDIHRETVAALMLFQEAVRQQQVTSRYLVRLRRYVEKARHNPDLAFERAS